MKKFFPALFCFLLFFSLQISAQENNRVQPKYKIFYIPKNQKPKVNNAFIIDSLTHRADSAIAVNVKLLNELNQKNNLLNKAISIGDAQVVVTQKLKGDFENQIEKNKKAEQKNFILIITNCLTVILVLILGAFLILKNKRKENPAVSVKPPVVAKQIVPDNNQPPNDNSRKLEQLERLAKMREQGILTDEEFNEKKRDVLGNNYFR